MKNLMQVTLMLLFTFSISFTSKAHGIVKTRNSCNWNFTGWKYVAKARVCKLGYCQSNQDGGCASGNYYASKANTCATQWAQNFYGSHASGGSVFKNYRVCSRGNASSELYYDYYLEELEENIFYESGKYSTSKIQFRSNEVIMDSINIELQAKGKDLFSSFEIMMWLPQNENDTVHSIEKSFLHGKITLMNGEAVGTGIFKELPMKVRKNSDGIYTVIISNFKAIGVLPTGITNEDNLIEVVTISDGGINENLSIEDALNKNILSIKTFPNPTNDIIYLSINDLESKEIYSITLYDMNGKMISIINSNITSENLINYQINLKKLLGDNKGIYYLFINSNNGKKKQLKKIIYQ